MIFLPALALDLPDETSILSPSAKKNQPADGF